MTKLAFAILAAALALPALSAAQAKPTKVSMAPAPAAPATSILEFYSTENFLEQSYSDFLQALARHKRELKVDKHQVDQLTALAKRIYPKSNLYGVFKDSFAHFANPKAAETFLKWTRSETGKKLAAAYRDLYSPGSPARLKHFLKAEERKKISANKKNSIQTFVHSSQQLDIYANSQAMADYAVNLGFNAFQPKTHQDSPAVIKTRSEKSLGGYRTAGKEPTLMVAMYLLRNIKGDAIDEISSFYATGAAEAVLTAYVEAYQFTLARAAETLAAAVNSPSAK